MSRYEPKITSSRCELIELSYNEIVMSAKDILDYGDIRPGSHTGWNQWTVVGTNRPERSVYSLPVARLPSYGYGVLMRGSNW